MNYEFHVGDYVENREGDVGWVTSVTDENIVWATNDGKTYVMEVSTLNRVQCPEALFVRIGAHDFTKKEKKKIEALTINKTMYQYTGDGTSNGGADYTAVYDNTKFQDKMIDKINELVDAVNELMDKEDKK